MYCLSCGSILPENSRFCTSCGIPVSPKPIPDAQGQQKVIQPKQSKTQLIVIFILSFVIICGGAIVLWLFTKTPTQNLNSFVLINNSLETTYKNLSNKNAAQMFAFDKEYALNPRKVQKYYDDAKSVKISADSLVNHIDFLKQYLIVKSDGLDSVAIFSLRQQWLNADAVNKLKLKQELDAAANLNNLKDKNSNEISNAILNDDDNNQYTASTLKLKIDNFREKLKAFVRDPSLISAFEENFNTNPTSNENWIHSNFLNIPIAACITNFTKIQVDIRNAESDVIKYLFQNVSSEDFQFDKIDAKVIPGSNYVLVGEKYSADIFVAAYNTSQIPSILIGEVDPNTNELYGQGDASNVRIVNGMGRYEVAAGAEGLKKWGGLLQVVSPSGEIKKYPFKGEYMVAKPALVVSPTKMNVLYIGVENPISISVPGVSNENLQPTLSGGTLRPGKEKGEYIAEVKGGSEATISLSAIFDNGTKNMGQFKFRVKRVPDPVPYIANKKDGLANANELIAAGAVMPKMENFDFDLQFRITSFDLSMNMQGDFITKSTTGNRLSAEMATMLKSAKKGTKVYIEEIKAIGPDGVPRKLGIIGLKLQ